METTSFEYFHVAYLVRGNTSFSCSISIHSKLSLHSNIKTIQSACQTDGKSFQDSFSLTSPPNNLILEGPFDGNVQRNVTAEWKCSRSSLSAGWRARSVPDCFYIWPWDHEPSVWESFWISSSTCIQTIRSLISLSEDLFLGLSCVAAQIQVLKVPSGWKGVDTFYESLQSTLYKTSEVVLFTKRYKKNYYLFMQN